MLAITSNKKEFTGLLLMEKNSFIHELAARISHKKTHLGAIQVLRNADGGGGCLIFWKKALRRCNVQCY